MENILQVQYLHWQMRASFICSLI